MNQPKKREWKFGDYCQILQKRYGAPDELYVHKVIRSLKSNKWVTVPVQIPAKEELHDTIEEVVACITCGVIEREVLYYKTSDIKI